MPPESRDSEPPPKATKTILPATSDSSGVDIKAEPSSPPTTPSLDPLTIDIKGPFDLPVLLPKIISVTTLRSSSDTSGGNNALGSNEREGPTGSSQKKPGSKEGASNECDVCGRRFASKDYVRKHRLKHVGKKPYPCFICGHRFYLKDSMLHHEKTHKDVKVYKCLVCNRKFLDESKFTEHQLMHMSDKMYACRMCASKFCTRETLERHERMHASGVDMWVCEECGMTFEQTTALERHLKLHVTEKTYACHLCPATFAKERSREKHVVRHVARKRRQCPVCGKTYCGYANLETHIRLMHGGASTTTGNTDGSVKILSDPLTTSPPDGASTNEKGPEGAGIWREHHCNASHMWL
ncbi:zinc finger protein OZF [Rhipicephalus sanguineus]|uniref:zinc finger protein OZF n=1 Tax=Rhipicephalus sanguineus TaxID=34632 RepID=UPI0020C55030|nr:zinc finger protein OZF [Rhipicephalus sanguineus]